MALAVDSEMGWDQSDPETSEFENMCNTSLGNLSQYDRYCLTKTTNENDTLMDWWTAPIEYYFPVSIGTDSRPRAEDLL